MSSPLVSPEFANLYVGDTKDDDGQVIDSLVQEVDAPATPVTEAIDQSPLLAPIKYGRLLTGAVVLNSTDYVTPTMVLPPDENRIHLRIDGYSLAAAPAAKDYASFSDENGKAQSVSGGTRLRHGKGYTLDDYTGALWVMPDPITSDNFEITWEAITK